VSEWLDLMLDEIKRKKWEQDEAREEQKRRKQAQRDPKSKNGPARPSGSKE